MGKTPGLPTPVDTVVPEGSPVSNDDSVASSVYSQYSEPEGEFWDNDGLDDFFHLPGVISWLISVIVDACSQLE